MVTSSSKLAHEPILVGESRIAGHGSIQNVLLLSFTAGVKGPYCLPSPLSSLILHLCWSVCYLAILVSIWLRGWLHLAFYVSLLYSPKLLDSLSLKSGGRGLYLVVIPQTGLSLSVFQSLPFWKWWEPMGNYNNSIQAGWQRIWTIQGWGYRPPRESTKVLAEGKGSTEWIVEEGSYITS